ncbi:MAG: helix-turn-helix domain-containing protein [Defluviitaleaceae bacterium]|nr:helix-turn-helix domain-containing protein [Defluviitaleaceae bacterium]
MKTSEKIRTLRKQRGLSQKDLAAELHVSHQSVSKWELNETLPELPIIVQLSRFFGVTTDYLLKEDEIVEKNEKTGIDKFIGKGNGKNIGFAKIKLPNSTSAKKVVILGASLSAFALVIFLVVGFMYDLWHPTWIVFLIAWAMAAYIAFKKFVFLGILMSAFALAIFLSAGFMFDMWHPGWIVFPLAWGIAGLREYSRIYKNVVD